MRTIDHSWNPVLYVVQLCLSKHADDFAFMILVIWIFFFLYGNTILNNNKLIPEVMESEMLLYWGGWHLRRVSCFFYDSHYHWNSWATSDEKCFIWSLLYEASSLTTAITKRKKKIDQVSGPIKHSFKICYLWNWIIYHDGLTLKFEVHLAKSIWMTKG